MPNQLTLPFRITSAIPIKSSLREYIKTAHTETHPDAFKWDVSKWEAIRKEAVTNLVHVNMVDKIIAYQAQLVFILTKLPVDIHLPVSYTRIFSPNSSSLTLSNLAYERVNVIYNLAALYCQLATSDDRSSGDGIKRAMAHFQNAAGALSYLISSALPGLETSLPANTALPSDLSAPFLKALECLMLAQAQECFWQRAVVDNVKNHLVARLSLKTSTLYRDALEAMEADATTSATFPREWIAHVRAKRHHFAAAALYRKSVDDLEANRYGEELARLDMAKLEAKRALDAARNSGVAKAVLDDIKSLNDTLESSYKRAERDNDLIYHHVVPSSSSIASIQDLKDVVGSLVPLGLRDPKTVVKEGDAILGELCGWGVRVAIDVYKERKKDWIQLTIVDQAKQLDATVTSTLQSLNLPAALDALDRPIGLPPSLLGKAEEVRVEDGMRRIPTLIEDVQRLARRDAATLDEALDILDQEATEDEELRDTYSVDARTLPVSHDANRELTGQAARYREVLEKAMESDRTVRANWEEWAERIAVLCWDENDIERAVPSSTVSSLNGGGSKSTQGHARALRSHLESLNDLVRSRAEMVRRVQRVADADDVAPRFMREAAAVASWVEVRPELFEQAIEEELGKYDKYKDELEVNERRQEDALNEIKERNSLFLDTRRDEPSVKAREHALQSLDLAYHQYRSICRDLTEGLKFYNDFAIIIAQLKENCRVWVTQRRMEVERLIKSFNSMSVAPPQAGSSTPSTTHAPIDLQSTPAPVTQTIPTPEAAGQRTNTAPDVTGSTPRPPNSNHHSPPPRADEFALDLPPPDSAAWETMALPAAAYKNPADARIQQPSRARRAAF